MLCVDATVMLHRRIAQGESFWRSHCPQYYQRLVLSGWSHRKTSLVEYGVMCACGIGALVFQQMPGGYQLLIVGIWALVFFGLSQSVSIVERRISNQGAFDGQ